MRKMPRCRRWRLRAALGVCRLSICLLILSGGAAMARAELVVFSDGLVVKAASHQIVGDQLQIDLPGGGSYRVNLARIERIVEDEVAASAAPPLLPAAPREPKPAAPAPHRADVAQPAADTQTPPPPPPKRGPHGGKGKRARIGRS